MNKWENLVIFLVSLEKYFEDRGINEIDLDRMVGKCCLSYIFSLYIEIFNKGIDTLNIEFSRF